MERKPSLLHSASSLSLRDVSKSSSSLSRFWHERRKISVDEILPKNTKPLATVKEVIVTSKSSSASPTEKLNSKAVTDGASDPFEDAVLAPVAHPIILPASRFAGLSKNFSLEDETPKSHKRASSMILPQGERFVNFLEDPPPYNSEPEEDGEKPPAVPPKSPRMVLHLDTTVTESPPPKKLSPAIQLQPTSNQSAPDMISPNPFTNPWKSTCSSKHQKRPSTADAASTVAPLRNNTPEAQRRGFVRHNKFPSDVSGISPTDPAGRDQSFQHKRQGSDNSIINRARPTKRVEGIVLRGYNKRRPSGDELLARELPLGVGIREAQNALNHDDLQGVLQQATMQAERFAILGPQDVNKLSRELRSLDERCEYLRKTYGSLRAGRRNLHSRMIGYLRSPVSSSFSRENILKQELALSELDISIDEWWCKWELAENRRSRVRQKLLEHIAAASMLKQQQQNAQVLPVQTESRQSLHVASQVNIAGSPQTPPRSPESACRPILENVRTLPLSPVRSDTESIKIYADSEVWALLADIEQEMEFMATPSLLRGVELQQSPQASVEGGLRATAYTRT